jgi:hypothetical protein
MARPGVTCVGMQIQKLLSNNSVLIILLCPGAGFEKTSLNLVTLFCNPGQKFRIIREDS